jgi:hypothetical protein
MGMPYINGVKHNAFINGQKIWTNGPGPGPVDDGVFSFTVADNGSFNIPVSGVNGGSSSFTSYNWAIDWGDGNIETRSGTSSNTATITHTYSDGKTNHKIKIMPNGSITQGWFNAFGSSANQTVANLAKIKSINNQITPTMRTMGAYSHSSIFRSCSGLTSIPDNLLPATTLANYCYSYMFFGCSGLTSVSSNLLPATSTNPGCYSVMFYGCTGLTSAPSFTATSIGTDCCGYMFQKCTGLTSVPIIPTATLENYCYEYMFDGCTGLTSVPSNLLPTMTLATSCYYAMFSDCTSLTDIGTIGANWFSARTNKQSAMFRNDTKIATPITYANIPSAWK